MTTALGLNAMVTKLPPLVGRIVPFVACCIANGINIPMMRRLELEEGKNRYTGKIYHISEVKIIKFFLNPMDIFE